MTHARDRDPRPTPTWPPTAGYSRVDLPVLEEDDEDVPERPQRDRDTTPNVAAVRDAGGNEVAKLIGGGSASVVVLALIDKALSNTGITAADVANHLGPMLGALYNTYPVVAILLVVLVFMLRSYRRDQEAHKRRDRRLQRALNSFGRGIKTEIEGLRGDVAGFTVALESVKSHVETRIAEEVRAVARVAVDRADRADAAIVELRGGLAELRTRVSLVETSRLDRREFESQDGEDGIPVHARRVSKNNGNGRGTR